MNNDKKYAHDLWKCDDCHGMDSHAHIVWCQASAALWERKDLECNRDLVKYYQKVIKIRETTKLESRRQQLVLEEDCRMGGCSLVALLCPDGDLRPCVLLFCLFSFQTNK